MLYNPTINLLPDNKKNRLKTLVKFIFAKDLLEMALLFYALLAIVFIWSWLTILNEYNNTAKSTTLVSRENSTRSREVRETNAILRQFNRSATGYLPFTPKLNDLITALPSDIKLNSVVFDRTQNNFFISGTAKTRAALLNYETVIKQYVWLQNITSPIAQLLEKENINFEMRAELTLTTSLPDAAPKSNKQ
jgi:hypothetical protein